MAPNGHTETSQPPQQRQQLLVDREETGPAAGERAQVPLEGPGANGLEVDHQAAAPDDQKVPSMWVAVKCAAVQPAPQYLRGQT